MRILIILIAIAILVTGCATKTTVIKTHPAENGPTDIKHSKVIVSDNHLEQGKRLYFKGKYNQATKHFIRSIANNSENWEAYYFLGLTQQKKERFDRSIGSFNNSLKFAPADRMIRSQINYALGLSWEQENYLAKAAEKFNKAIKLNPNYTQAKVAAGRVKDKTLKAETRKKKGKGKKTY
jgi:tetratricopeptide (TPR) repeat protein